MNATTLPILDLARYADPAEKNGFSGRPSPCGPRDRLLLSDQSSSTMPCKKLSSSNPAAFFALPDEQKQPVAMIHSPHFRGYNRAASELTRGQPDWREQFDIGAERPALRLDDDAPRWQRLQGPNLWPEALPTLKPTLLSWQRAMTEVGTTLLRAFAEALALPDDAFETLYGNKPNEHIKLIRYPGQHETQSHQASARIKTPGSSASCFRMSKRVCR